MTPSTPASDNGTASSGYVVDPATWLGLQHADGSTTFPIPAMGTSDSDQQLESRANQTLPAHHNMEPSSRRRSSDGYSSGGPPERWTTIGTSSPSEACPSPVHPDGGRDSSTWTPPPGVMNEGPPRRTGSDPSLGLQGPRASQPAGVSPVVGAHTRHSRSEPCNTGSASYGRQGPYISHQPILASGKSLRDLSFFI